MKVSFVIPTYENFRLVNQLLVDIQAHTRPDEVLVVDDSGNDVESLNGLAWWARNGNVKVKRTIQNLGFLKSSNWGMSMAEGDILVLISTDVRIETDLAQIVKDLLSQNPKWLIGGIVYDTSTGWNKFGDRIFEYAEGWLLACTKEAWKDFGGFDEQYSPSDFEDVDISTTAMSKGYELYSLSSPHIRHLGAQTYGYTEERRERTERNRKIFEEKWLKQNLPPSSR